MSVSNLFNSSCDFDLYANSITVNDVDLNGSLSVQNLTVDGEYQRVNRAHHLNFGFLGFTSTEAQMGIDFDSHSIYPRLASFTPTYWVTQAMPRIANNSRNLFFIVNCDIARDPLSGFIYTGNYSLTHGSLVDTANGVFDSYYRAIFAAIKQYSVKDASRVMFSIMAEEDGRDTMPWQAYTSFNGIQQTPAQYIAAFRHVYTLCRTEFPELNEMRFVHWMNCTESFDTDYEAFYPGDAYCELNAFSMYNRTLHIWNQPCKNFIRPYVETCRFSIHPIMFGECNCMPTDDTVSTPDPTGLYNKGEWLRRMVEVVDMYFTRVEWIHLFNENTTHLWEWSSSEQIVVRDAICDARARNRSKKATEIIAPNLFPFPMPTNKDVFTYTLATGSIVTDLPDDLMGSGVSSLHIVNTNDDNVESSSKVVLVDNGTYMPVIYQPNQPFVLSFWARGEQASSIFSYGYENITGGVTTLSMYRHATLTKEWNRYFYICTMPWDITSGVNNICWYFGENDHGLEFDICGIQICKTTFITPFTISANQSFQQLAILGTSQSSSTSTGSLTCAGGVGIAKDLHVGGTIYGTVSGTVTQDHLDLSGTADSTGTASGTLTVAGGAGITKKLYVGGNVEAGANISAVSVSILGTTGASSTTTGALVIAGGVSLAEDIYVGSNIYCSGSMGSVYANIAGTTESTSSSTGSLVVTGGASVGGHLYTGNNITSGGNITGSNLVSISTTASTSTSTGSLRIAGGAGIAGNLNIGGTLAKGTGSFLIPHPDPSKEGWKLRHCFVESDTRGDNIYRRRVEAENGTAEITLPDYFKYLNENTMVFVSPVGSFGVGCGYINDDMTKIIINVSEDGIYNVMIVATRKDKIARDYFDEHECEIPPTN